MKIATGKSNIDIVKNYLDGIRPFTTIGYTGEINKYKKEGETWIDSNGIEWQRKSGRNVKLTKSQADIIREAIGNQKCKCGLEIKWGNKFDRLFFAKTGMCQDCLVDYEHKLRMIGIYEAYEKYKILSNEIGFFKDAIQKIKETIKFFSQEDTSIEVLCNSEGFLEKFHGTNKDKILKDAKEDLIAVRKHLKEITKQTKKIKAELKLKASEFKIKLYV